MNPLKANGGIFVRSEIIGLMVLNDRDKMLLAAIDNYENGFDENMRDAAAILRCSESQASNSFEKLRALNYITKDSDATGWVLNENGPWLEGSK